ncbi:HET-domain-containing protein [Daldinia grandis]|nr:HET-domain-containing protein [Daldinia grandis]
MADLSHSIAVEDEVEHYQFLSLDRPCQHCKVLELDDAGHGGTIKYSEDGGQFVEFGEVQETNAERRKDNYASIAAMAGAGTLNELRTWPRLELELSYKRHDTLPDLPGFVFTGSQGCAFCNILRKDIMSSWDNLRDRISQGLGDGEKTHQAKLDVSGMTYKLYEPSHDKDDGVTGSPKRVYLDSLYVFFTIEWGSEKDDYSLHYNIHTDARDPCTSWFRIWRRPIANEYSSPPSIRRLNTLIAKSLSEVPVPIENKYYPTRLLDVGLGSRTGLSLIISKESTHLKNEVDPARKRYAALSYCWGSKSEAERQLKTTRDSIKNHTSQIKLESLPQTVADAVQVCRALGIRYLWVDALCIIQDDPDDWAAEAFEMSNVYAHSFITLCILQGESCLSGFSTIPHAPQMLKINFRSKLDSSVSGKLYLRMMHTPEENLKQGRQLIGYNSDVPAQEDFDKAAWSKRGWTFQEAQLSPRKLFFGKLTFHFDCGNIHESADGSKFDGHGLVAQGDMELNGIMKYWYRLVTEYGNRTLTYEHDRFPALSALARSISGKFPDQQYLAGLWKSDLHRGLLWTPYAWTDLKTYLERLEGGYTAPTWSWASRPNGLVWVGGFKPDNPFSPEFELGDTIVVAENLNPYGRVSSATLELYTKAFQFPLSKGEGKIVKAPDSEWRWLQMNFHYTLVSEKDEYIASLHLDWLSYGTEGFPEDPMDQLWMVLISSSSIDKLFYHWSAAEDKYVTDPEMMIGLLVQPNRKEGEFIKVGLWYSETRGLGGRKFWDDIPKRSIKLV